MGFKANQGSALPPPVLPTAQPAPAAPTAPKKRRTKSKTADAASEPIIARKRGRKPKDPGDKKSKSIVVACTPTEYDAILAIATQYRLSAPEYLRRAAFVAQNQRDEIVGITQL